MSLSTVMHEDAGASSKEAALTSARRRPVCDSEGVTAFHQVAP